MPATSADIGAATRDALIVTWSSPAMAARYASARDGSVEPTVGYFDTAADAQAVNDQRGALIGTERRRFAVKTAGLVWPIVSAAIPQARVIDAEQALDATHLVARIEVDLEAETTTLETFG
jgi:hypothetical protein